LAIYDFAEDAIIHLLIIAQNGSTVLQWVKNKMAQTKKKTLGSVEWDRTSAKQQPGELSMEVDRNLAVCSKRKKPASAGLNNQPIWTKVS
jgi:hypothetical protein